MNRKYSDAQRQWIRRHAPTMSDKDAVEEFNRTFGQNVSVQNFHKLRQRLGVVKKRGRPRPDKDK